jgi:phosphoribosylaminoimidazolecarboxamide formyltransferase/IMP cyclohydrolase
MSTTPIRRALLSVSDKTGLVEFARGLCAHGVEIISTGGTAQTLREADIPLLEVAEFTGFPEVLDGRVKTLHPAVHAGILYRRDQAAHVETLASHGLAPIDLVAVNLYPFEETVARAETSRAEAVEQIDIGGPSMIRSAAKNHESVTVVVSPDQYGAVLAELDQNGGATSVALRQRLAAAAFRRTATYDAAIHRYLEANDTDAEEGATAAPTTGLPARLELSLVRRATLRYGENPHQQAALYGDFLDRFRQLHGKELSYNNILDFAAAQEMASRLDARGAAVVIVKHSNPCGAAVARDVEAAWHLALATDPQSASGGIVASSRPLDGAAAEAMKDHFIELLAAPSFTPEALEILTRKKNRILLAVGDGTKLVPSSADLSFRSVPGGVLAQTVDTGSPDDSRFEVVTQRAPSAAELDALRFGWEVVRFVKSNAIIFTDAMRTLGVGAGQMSRVDSVQVAVMKAKASGLDLAASAVASDAFFPFADGLVAAAAAGATAAVQPGGSVRDNEVIAAADERGIAMVFTGARHFRH